MDNTVDYPTRAAMVGALLDARKNGVHVDVVGNGRTLRYPAASETASYAPETPAPPAVAPQAAPAPAEPAEELSEPSVPADGEEETPETTEESVEDEPDEDLIGDAAPAPTKSSKKRKN